MSAVLEHKTAIPRPATVPANAVLITLAWSEVCAHMRVAGTEMWVAPTGARHVQLYTLYGERFSFPITRGEAGL